MTLKNDRTVICSKRKHYYYTRPGKTLEPSKERQGPVGPDQITLSGKTPVPKYTHPLTDSFDW